MKIVLFVFLNCLLLTSETRSQQHKHLNDPFPGLYFGGQTPNIGYYYFKADSSFIFIKTGLKKDNIKRDFENQFDDTLSAYGIGKWFIRDSFFIINFREKFSENITSGDLKYKAYSQAPFDSLLLSVTVTNFDNQTLNIASVIIGDRFIANPTGGEARSKLPLSFVNQKLEVYKTGYLKQDLYLIKGYNAHELTITLAPDDGSTIEIVSAAQFPYRYHKQNGSFRIIGSLKKQREGPEKITQLVKNGFAKFPKQHVLISEILRYLN